MGVQSHAFGGGCICGDIRFRLWSKPLFVHCCHCRWCQRETGTSFALNALIEADRLAVLGGHVEVGDAPSYSGNGQRILGCPACRISLWSDYSGAGDKEHFVRIGTLDDANRFTPDIHIFTESKQDWVILPDDAPAVPAYYRAAEYRPSASLVRLRRLGGRWRR